MFLHPWAIFLGLIAAGLPVAVHFLTRPKPRVMRFSALRFVQEMVNERKSRHRLRDAVILALRTTAVLLLALAIARPLWNSSPQAVADDDAEVVRVVLLDVSQSMGTAHHGATLLERARPLAARHLEQRPGLKANLLLAGARPAAVFERPASNFPLLHEELSKTTVLPQHAQVQAALNLAAEMLSAPNGETMPRRELIVISDFQRSNWASADFSVLPAETRIVLESVAPSDPTPNLGLLRVATQERPEAGREFRLETDIGNYSPTPRTVRVELTLGSAAFEFQGVCAPFSKTTLSGDVRMPAEGWQLGNAKLIDVHDSLAADDVRPFVVDVRPPAAYALLTRQSASQRPSSSYFLERALSPIDASEDSSATKRARVIRVDPAALDAESLSGVELMVIDHPGRLEPAVTAQLASLLRRGRALLYVCSEMADASNLRQLIGATDGRLQLPVEFLPPAGNRPRRDLFLADVRGGVAPFQIFGDDLKRLVGPIRISGGLETRLREGAVPEDIYAQLNDRSALLAFASTEGGRVIVLNADLGASNLPVSPLFVPLIGEIVRTLVGQGNANREVAAGESFVIPLPPDVDSLEGLQIVGPSETAAGMGSLARDAAETIWKGEAANSTGVYRVVRRGATVSAVATVIPPSESDLRVLPADVFQSRLAGGRDVQFRSYAAAEREEQDSLWSWLAVGCVLCWIGELAALKGFRV